MIAMKLLTRFLIPALCIQFFCTAALGQKTFLRLFNLKGNRLQTGRLLDVTDSSIILLKHGRTTEWSYRDLGSIRSGRSFGHAVLAGSAVTVPVTIGSIFFFRNFPEPVGSLEPHSKISTGNAIVQGTFYGSLGSLAALGLQELFVQRYFARIDGKREAFLKAAAVLKSLR
ncbi:MAG: hypothetical protein JO301_08255 [Chitinophagaceae bacterium]|nr:hypothetical protein [Chitinophagaceae bacterium]